MGAGERAGELRQTSAELQEALRRSETYLAEAQRLSHTGSWAWDIATGEHTHSSDEYARLFGFDPQRDRPSRNEFLQRIHPEDRGRLAEIIEKAARERMDYEVDFRVVLPDGTVQCIHAVGHPVFSASGDLVQFVGTVMDVTERRRAEEEHQAHLWFLECARGRAVGLRVRSIVADLSLRPAGRLACG